MELFSHYSSRPSSISNNSTAPSSRGRSSKVGKSAKVEDTAGWREIARGERALGLNASPKVLISFFSCAICGCCIGPGYVEQHMYFYPVSEKRVYIAKVNCEVYFKEETWLTICGQCARYHTRLLPEWLVVIFPACWETTLLICSPDERPRPINLCNVTEVTTIRHALYNYVKYSQRFAPIFLSLLRLLPYLPSGPFTYFFLRHLLTLLFTQDTQEKRNKKEVLQEHNTYQRRIALPLEEQDEHKEGLHQRVLSYINTFEHASSYTSAQMP